MTAPTVVDYSWARPDPNGLRAVGIVGVMRYLSWDASKNLTKPEADALHNAGLWIGLNWEGTGNWQEFSGGTAAGERAGREAARQCRALGVPASIPIFVSADYGAPVAQWPTIQQFLAAFTRAAGYPVGIYGQGDLIDWLLDHGPATVGWQTNAHSWGGVSARAVLYQAWPPQDVAGGQCDLNTLAGGDQTAWQWSRATQPLPNPSTEDDMTPEQQAQLTKAVEQASQANLRSAANQATLANLASAVSFRAVIDLYNVYLGRAPKPPEIAYWAPLITSKGQAWCATVIAQSAEAKAHAGA